MNIVKEFPIRQSFAGFKYYLKVYAFAIRYEISLQEDKEPLVRSNLKSYSEALRILELDKAFNESLTDEEKEVVSYCRYHNQDETKPVLFDFYIQSAYKKWLRAFFYNRHQSKLLKRIDSKRLGKVMKKIRKDNSITKVKLAYVFETSVRTVERYESGETIPSFEYMINFAMYFDEKIDEIIDIIIWFSAFIEEHYLL